MKKFVIFLLLLIGIFVASNTFATEWYTVNVLNGSVIANQGGGVTLPAGAPNTAVLPLDQSYAPFISGPAISGLAPLPTAPAGDGWNAAGWWTFAVNASSGSGWNNVFGGGNYTFTSDWVSPQLGQVHFADIDMTFADIYGKWSMNNDSVWTYFGLYVAPNTPAAQLQGPPIGIFAFVADDPLLSPHGFSLANLYAAMPATGAPYGLQGGTGRFEAVPEPATMLLLGLGLMGLAGIRRKFRS